MRKLAPLALVSLIVAGCGQHAVAPASSARKTSAMPPVILTAKAVMSHVSQTVELTGAIAPRHIAVVAAQQAGRVASLSVREGDAVKAGDTVGGLDATTYAAGVVSASGADQSANAATQAAVADIANADAALTVAHASYEASAASARNARAHAQRLRSLFEQGAVSREMRDDAATASDRAVAELSAAGAAIAQARSTAVSARAHEAMAAGQSIVAQGEAQQAAANLDQTSIIAPFDGVVTKRWLDVGAYANPGTPLVTIESSDQLEVDVSVPEEDAAAITPGENITIVVDALSGRRVSAKVRALVPSAADNSHQYAAKLDVPYRRDLLPGMFVRARVAAHVVSGIGVPASAVATRFGQIGVFIVETHRAEFQPVAVIANDGKTAIITGVTEGTKVATAPSDLYDGEIVADRSSAKAVPR
jgi:multidrug efflux pump subunit AcrA (membrane-fusion protein)